MRSIIQRNLLFVFFLFLYLAGNTQKLLGFSEADSKKEIEKEKRFDSYIDTKDQDEWMKFLSSHPHHVGSPQDKANAEYIASLFRQWGYQTEIKTYYVLFPTPKFRLLELNGPKPYKAKLQESAIAEDHTSQQIDEQLPTYNAYSADGDVTSELVFVNHGVPDDYNVLEQMGISVKGKIVIAKYGGSWRGIKPKVAAEHGAIGCIIYSDPADDGYGAGDVYPKGSFRKSDAVQRGSVMDMPVYPGDPLTPGVGATKEAKRLDRKDAITIMKIPVLPISYEDALPLLQSLGGQVVPASWRGGLPITYHVGPSLDKVHLKLEFNWDQKPVNDIIAKLSGSQFPDQWIIRGNHHDGWVNGASDPLSGMVSELSEAKSIGLLVKQGYHPKRTIVYCAWDGEEPALLGSTEWVEDHQQELKNKAVIYVNTDGNGRGFLQLEGSHTLEPFMNELTNDVIDPQTDVSVKTRTLAKQIFDADNEKRKKLFDSPVIKLGALGAGSDFSPFLQYLGIASINIGFGGEDQGGEYHSIYDSYDMFTRFKDPGFKYGAALSKTTGRVILRFADADILPFDFISFYNAVSTYENEVKSLLEKERDASVLKNRMINEHIYSIALDPTKNYVVPKVDSLVPFLNFSDLDNELVKLKNAAQSFSLNYSNIENLPADKKLQINEILFKAERNLIYANGLPRRPWYKHEIYAPGFYTGYGVKTLPGIREAIEQRNWKEAQQNILIVSQVLEQYNHQLQMAINLIAKPTF